MWALFCFIRSIYITNELAAYIHTVITFTLQFARHNSSVLENIMGCNRILAYLSAGGGRRGVRFTAGDRGAGNVLFAVSGWSNALSDLCMCVIIACWKCTWWNQGMKWELCLSFDFSATWKLITGWEKWALLLPSHLLLFSVTPPSVWLKDKGSI